MSLHPSLAPGNAYPTFIGFVFGEKSNRKFLWIAGIGTIIQFVVFKLLYPFADFFGDSYSYIYAASAHLDINIWPIGYSKFLAVFHVLTHSDTALVAFQYFFLEGAALYFFFTLTYFFRPARTISLILFLFLFFNPLFLYLSNYVNSDPLFAALSLFWFTELIWIIRRPRLYQLFTQAIWLILAFTVRHNAMYYPFIGALAFALSRQPIWRKWAGALLGASLVVLFVVHERNAAYRLYGIRQFSPMSGWVLANNALYMYGHIKVDSTALPTTETRELDHLAKEFYRPITSGFDAYLFKYSATFFMREPYTPLKIYFSRHYKPTSELTNLIAYAKASAVFGEYGSWLIRQHPIAFAKYFLWLNTRKYFFPPLEKLEVYNMGAEEVRPIASAWFDYETEAVESVSGDAQGIVLLVFPGLFLMLNLYLLVSGVVFLVRKKYRRFSLADNRFLMLLAALLTVNFFFSVFVSIVVLRYQFFPLIVCVGLSLLWMEWSAEGEKRGSAMPIANPVSRHPLIPAK